MKMIVSFIAGIVVCSLILFGVRTVSPTRADTTASNDESENVTLSLLNLLPDFERIYRESLTMPFIKAESKIYDEDIREFYRGLMEKTGLTDPGTSANQTE